MAGLGGRVTIGSDAVGSGVHCGGSQRESSMLRGGQVAETGPRHRRLVRSLPQWPRRQGGPGLRSGGREVWEGARPCGEAAADGAS